MSSDRLTMPIGEVMFTQRSVRKFRPDPIPVEDIRLILEAAVKAPNGANRQIGRFLVVDDREKIREFARLYHEAWWAKRRDERGWTRPQDIPPEEKSYRAAMALADEIKDVPCIVFAFTVGPGGASSVIPACQNLMLTDVAMPRMSGPALADRLWVTRPRVKVLYMSGYSADALEHQGVLGTGAALLEKPFTVMSLLGKVREVLEG